MLQLCEALEVLHGCNPSLIHRDIKPSNVLVNEEGILKIIDFDASRQYRKTKNTSDTRLLGTIEYAAPAQFGYAQTDFRSDIYSAGVVFSEIVIDEKSAFAKEWKRLVDKCTRRVRRLSGSMLSGITEKFQSAVTAYKLLTFVGGSAILRCNCNFSAILY